MLYLELQTSRELKVQGSIGACVSTNMKGASVSDTEIGMGGTCQWKMCGLYPNTHMWNLFRSCQSGNLPLICVCVCVRACLGVCVRVWVCVCFII